MVPRNLRREVTGLTEIKMPNGYTNWCGTLQVEREIDVEGYFKGLMDRGKAKFIIGQLEEGSHLHLQYYIQREKRVSLVNMKREICDKTHWEPAKGSAEDNIKYCSKESTRVAGPWQYGECTTQGQRTDLDKAASMIDEGKSLREVAIECKTTFIRHHKGLRAYEAITRSKGPRKCEEDGPEVWVFWGPTGTGKSRRAFHTWPDAYRKPTSEKWWDGYCGQDTVIFDDFKGSSMKLHEFQMVIDRYPMQVEVKGAFVDLSATRYVFTSNKHPSEWYSDGTVMRRINEFCDRFGRLIHCVQQVDTIPESWLEAWATGMPE